jgi:hypothetical protein
MKRVTYAVALLAFAGFSLPGCVDQSQSPVAPTDRAAREPAFLEKGNDVSFTLSSHPVWVDPNPDMKLSGGRLQMKNVAVWDMVSSSDQRFAGRMEHSLSLTLDVVTGEGPCHGSYTLIPDPTVTRGGVWEGTYEGYRSKTTDPYVFVLPLKLVGQGRGGAIDGMQAFCKATLTVYTNAASFPVPTYWECEGTGFIKEH